MSILIIKKSNVLERFILHIWLQVLRCATLIRNVVILINIKRDFLQVMYVNLSHFEGFLLNIYTKILIILIFTNRYIQCNLIISVYYLEYIFSGYRTPKFFSLN